MTTPDPTVDAIRARWIDNEQPTDSAIFDATPALLAAVDALDASRPHPDTTGAGT